MLDERIEAMIKLNEAIGKDVPLDELKGLAEVAVVGMPTKAIAMNLGIIRELLQAMAAALLLGADTGKAGKDLEKIEVITGVLTTELRQRYPELIEVQ